MEVRPVTTCRQAPTPDCRTGLSIFREAAGGAAPLIAAPTEKWVSLGHPSLWKQRVSRGSSTTTSNETHVNNRVSLVIYSWASSLISFLTFDTCLDFYNWNKVFVRYCDGASFAGDSQLEDQVSDISAYWFIAEYCNWLLIGASLATLRTEWKHVILHRLAYLGSCHRWTHGERTRQFQAGHTRLYC
jgi:hypothetical protein